jgi:hypothetical protein
VLRYETLDGREELAEHVASVGEGMADQGTTDGTLATKTAADLAEAVAKSQAALPTAELGDEFKVAPGHTVRRFTEALLRTMIVAGKFQTTWSPLFDVLGDIVDVGGRGAAAFVVARGGISMACELAAENTPADDAFALVGDFVPANVAMRAELIARNHNNIYAVNKPTPLTDEEKTLVRTKPTRAFMHNKADTASVREFILKLVLHCNAPSGVAGSPHAGAASSAPAAAAAASGAAAASAEPLLPLPAPDALTLMSEPVLNLLMLSPPSGLGAAATRDAVRHLMWHAPASGVRALSASVRETPTSKNIDGFAIAPLFWGLEQILDVGDGEEVQGPRVHDLLDAAIEGMQKAARFYHLTLKGLRMFAKVAWRSQAAADWVAANSARMEWAVEWLEANPKAPVAAKYGVPAATGVVAFKGDGKWGSYLSRPPDLLPNAKRMAAGKRPVFVDRGYDDDDPQSLVGKRIRINLDNFDKNYRWLRARCVAYIDHSFYHRIVHDWEHASTANRIRYEIFRLRVIEDSAPLLEAEDPPPPGIDPGAGTHTSLAAEAGEIPQEDDDEDDEGDGDGDVANPDDGGVELDEISGSGIDISGADDGDVSGMIGSYPPRA